MYNIPARGARPFNRRMLVAGASACIAFISYCCVYAYRKPFTVASFDGLRFFGMSYQTILIIFQVIGYMGSKFYGIKLIAELNQLGRFRMALTLVGIAWLSLFFFAVVPAPYGALCMLVNGFMLGFLWGIIFSYLEGRKATDFIGAVMAVSFIFAGGFTRSVAAWLMIRFHITEWWMPFATGLVFILPLVFFLWLLDRMPPPDKQDIEERMPRVAMNGRDRANFLKKFGAGIAVMTVTYLFLTVMRDIRDNYMGNIWTELGYAGDYGVFTRTETVTSLVILAMMGLLVLIKKSMTALRLAHLIIATGIVLAGLSSLLFMTDKISGALWMQIVSLGLYMGYIPFNCIFFERFIAAFKIRGNIGFLMYFADAFGYLGSVAVMLLKEFSGWKINWSAFYSQAVIIFSVIALACIIYSYIYLKKKYNARDLA